MRRKLITVLVTAFLVLGLPVAALAWNIPNPVRPTVVGPTRPSASTVTPTVVPVRPSVPTVTPTVVPSRNVSTVTPTVAPARRTASVTPTVVPARRGIPDPVSLTVSPTSVNLQVGQSQMIEAQVTFTDGSTRDAARNCVCIVSNSRVVSYRSGLITALSPGTATVTLVSYGKTAQIKVAVADKEIKKIPNPVSLTVSPQSVDLEVGQEQEIKATLTFSDGSVKDAARNGVYIVSNSRVISYQNGRIKALSPGSATLTIMSYGKTARINVNVAEKAAEPPQKPGVEEVPAVKCTGNAVTENYEWQYAGKTYQWRLSIPKSLLDWSRSINETTEKFYEADGYTKYAMLQSMPPSLKDLVMACSIEKQSNLTPWVNEPNNNSFISVAASALAERARADNLNRFQTAELALSFVQSIPYEVTKYPVLPTQTLADRKGDCDVKSVLLASLLKRMGYDVALLYYNQSSTGKDAGHMAVGIAFSRGEVPASYNKEPLHYYEYQGRNYYTAETTCERPLGTSMGWMITKIYPV